MSLDIRFLLGLIFAITGTILVIVGLVTKRSHIDDISLGINRNLALGSVIIFLGIVLTLLGRERP